MFYILWPNPFYLYGRIHIDIETSLIYKEVRLEGLSEISRICRIPMKIASRATIGRCLSSLYFYNAGKKGILVPWKPTTSEIFKRFTDLLNADKGGFIYINSTKFHDSFAQDVNLSQADIMAAVQKPINQSILAEKSGPPAWKQIPSWYQISENDHSIPPSLEQMFAKQINATTISIPSSHASLVSHPKEVAQLILNATKDIRK